nr:hypothetical protein [Tanacetum cinerariifolium]
MVDLAFAPQLNIIAYLEKTERDDSLVRVATTASLDAQQDSSNITKTQSKATLNEPTPQGEGSASGLRRQETMGGAMAQIRSKGALIHSIDLPLSTGYTVRSGEDRLEHDIELTDPVQQTPYDSPLSRGHTPGSDDGSMTLKKLTDLCTTLLQKRNSLGRRKVSKQKRKNLKSRQMFQDNVLDEDADTKMIVEDKGNGEKGGSIAETVSTARPDISAARPEVSIAEPKTPLTTITLFDDEDVTIADTLTKKKDQDQIERDAEVTLKIQAHLNEEVMIERKRQKKASKATLAEMYDKVQAQIDADHELAVRLTLEEQEKSFKEIQKLYIKKQKWVDAFVPIGYKEDKKRIKSRKKRAAGSNSKHKSPKKQKVNDQDSEDSDKEHRKCLKPSDPTEHVADEAINEEMDDNLGRATTTATSVDAEQDKGNISKTQSKTTPNEPSSKGTSSGGGLRLLDTTGDTIAQDRSENVSKFFNDPLLVGVNTPQSGEDSLKLIELIELCTNLQQRVINMETTKTSQAQEITSLKKRVKRLEKKKRSRTHGLKRLYKVGLSARIESSDDDQSLDEKDASKQGRIVDIDVDEGFTLVNETTEDQGWNNDEDMFGVNDLDGDEVIVKEQAKEVIVEKKAIVIVAATITFDDITLAKALEALKTSKPKIRGIIIRDHEEPGESRTTTTVSLKKSQNKGKAKMIKEPMKSKKKDQILLDEEVAKKLQDESNEEERLAGERARIDADFELAQRLQAKEQDELTDAENAKLFMELLEKRRKFFATKRDEERRNRPPTKAQKRSFMCTYLKNIKGYKAQSLKNISFAKIQEMFDKAMKRKVIKKGKKSCYQIIRVDGSSKKYIVFSHMLKDFNREDVETLWTLVKAKHGSTRLEEGYERVLWGDLKDVIENGNSPLITKVVEGVEIVIAPSTNKEKSQRRLLRKEVLDQTFERLQKLISQLEIHGETISQEDVNQKFLRSLSPEWNTHTIVWRNKPEVKTLSLDDLYSNLKIYEPEVKGTSSSTTNLQNKAFVSSNSTSNTNATVNTACGVSTASSQVNIVNSSNIDNLSDAAIYDLEEMDLKWQMVMFTLRARRFLKKIDRKLTVNDNETIGFDKSNVECYNYHKRGYFARECRAPRHQDNKQKETTRRNVPDETLASTALVSCDGLGSYDWSDQAEDGPTNFVLMAYSSTSSNFEDVIENGNSPLITKVVEGVEIVIAPSTNKEKSQRRLELKERSTLLMGILNEHKLNFNSKDAKLLLQATEKRNKPEVETLSLDDLYSNLKIYEPEVKRTSSSTTNLQNKAFVSSNNTSNTNAAVNTACGVSTASSQVNIVNSSNIDNLSDAAIYDLEEMDLKWQMAMLTMRARRFLKKIDRKLTVNDNETIGFDKSNVECYNYHKRGYFARECRAPRHQDNKQKETTRRNVPVETLASTTLVSCDGLGSYDWSDQAKDGPTNFVLMAYSFTSSNFEVRWVRVLDMQVTLHDKRIVMQVTLHYETIGMQVSLHDTRIVMQVTLHYEAIVMQVTLHDKRIVMQVTLYYEAIVMQVTMHDKRIVMQVTLHYEAIVMQVTLHDKRIIVDKYKAGLGYNVVPPPYTGNFMHIKPNLSGLEEFVTEPIVSEPTVKKPIVESSDDKDSAVKPKVWKPKIKVIEHVPKHNSASITLKKFDYVDARGRSNNELPFDPKMPDLEDISTFTFSNEDEDDGVEADLTNLDTSIQVSPTPTTRIHKDHPLDQVIRDVQSAIQTWKMSKNLEEYGSQECKNTYETQKPLLKDEDGEEVDVRMYRSMIGSLMYITSSKPNIMFAVCACARYQVNPKVSHLRVIKKIV